MTTQLAPRTTSDGSLSFEVVLDSVPSAGSMARRRIDALADHLPAPSLLDLQVIVTELVNNSVRHGSGRPIEVTVEVATDGSSRGTVSDGGVGPVEIAPPRDAKDRGLGLLIVDTLASRWGVNDPSSDVWFELAPVS